MTNFPNGVRSRGIPAEGIALMPFLGPAGSAAGSGGVVYHVDANATGASNNHAGTNPNKPLASLAGAESLVVANRGDVVIVGAGHTETWATLAASPTLAKAGVRWVFQRVGAKVATFTVGSSANLDATLTISAASIKFGDSENMPIFIPGVDSVVTPVTISAANASLAYEIRDTSAAVEFVRHLLTTAGADNLRADIKVRGFIAGNACVNSIRLVGVDGARINVDFYGIASTSVVEFLTTACHDVVVTGRAYNSGTTDGSKLVVDTATGSTWFAAIEDGAAGATFSGGSGAALAKDDVSSVSSALATLQAEVSGGAGLVTWPAAAAAGNGVSIAEVVRYIEDALIGTAGVVTFPAAAVPGNGVSLAEVLRDLWDGVRNGTGGSEPGTNKSILDALGFDGAAAIAASAGMLRTMAGTTFVVSKTITASQIVAAGIDLTAVSTVGAILIEDVIIQNGATQMDSAGNAGVVELYTDNAAGSASFITDAEALLLANAVVGGQRHTTENPVVLETGKKVKVKATTEDFTSVGNVTFHIICRRLADNATLVAA